VIKILFIRSEKAFLPEIDAYIKYFNRTDEFRAFDSAELPSDYRVDDFHVVWEFKGIGGIDRKDKILVHEYASLSTGSLPKLKNIIKTFVNEKPSLRIFLNEHVKEGYPFRDNVDFCMRDMGVDESFLGFRDAKKEYEFVYVGPVSKSREIDKLLKKFARPGHWKICLIGNVDDEIYQEYKKDRDIIFTGKVPYSEVPKLASKGVYGINYIPVRYPYFLQTSTKLLEYLALGLKIITTAYLWVNEFEQANRCSFYKLDYNNIYFDFEEIERFEYVSNFLPEIHLWNNIIDRSEIKTKLLKIHKGI